MNPGNTIKLYNWVQDNRHRIELAQKPMTKVAAEASQELQIKVPASALRNLFVEMGIPTRRKPKVNREQEALKREIATMKDVLVKVLTAVTVPEYLREMILTPELDEEIQALIRRQAS